MLNEENIQKRTDDYHQRVKGLFKKYELKVDVLDKDKTGSRPDYFVYFANNHQKGFVCECKYIASAGTINNGRYQVSTHSCDLAKRGNGGFQFSPYEKIKAIIEKALLQYEALKKDKPEYATFPFVVSLELDFWADSIDSIPNDIYGLKEVSAVMKIEEGLEQKEEFAKWSLDELKRVIMRQLKKKTPPKTVRFRVLSNMSARVKFQATDFLKNPITDE
jgi:hypothetical protein